MLDIKSDLFTDTFRNYIKQMYKDNHLEVVVPRYSPSGSGNSLSGKDEVTILYPYSVTNKQGHCMAECYVDGKYEGTLEVDYDGVIQRTEKVSKEILPELLPDVADTYTAESFKAVQTQRDKNIYAGFALLAYHGKKWDGYAVVDRDAKPKFFVIVAEHEVVTKETISFPVKATSEAEARAKVKEGEDFTLTGKEEISRVLSSVVKVSEGFEGFTDVVDQIIEDREGPEESGCKSECGKYPSCVCGDVDTSEDDVAEELPGFAEPIFDDPVTGGIVEDDPNAEAPANFPEPGVDQAPTDINEWTDEGNIVSPETCDFQVIVKNKWASGVKPIVHRGFDEREPAEAFVKKMQEKYNLAKYDVLLTNDDGDTNQIQMNLEEQVSVREYIFVHHDDDGMVEKKELIKLKPSSANIELKRLRGIVEDNGTGYKVKCLLLTLDGLMHNTENGNQVVIEKDKEKDAAAGTPDADFDYYIEIGYPSGNKEEK